MDVQHKGTKTLVTQNGQRKDKKKSRENSTLQNLIKIEEKDRRLIYKNLGY